LVYTAFPEGDNSAPRIGFLEMPSRNELSVKTYLNSINFTIFFHPLGNYLAILNE